jgi:hypothetical protein
VRFITVLGNTVGADYNYLDLLISRFLFPIRYLVTKSDLRCFVALAGFLPAGKDTSVLVGLTHPCRRNLRHFLLQSCFETWVSVRDF